MGTQTDDIPGNEMQYNARVDKMTDDVNVNKNLGPGTENKMAGNAFVDETLDAGPAYKIPKYVHLKKAVSQASAKQVCAHTGAVVRNYSPSAPPERCPKCPHHVLS